MAIQTAADLAVAAKNVAQNYKTLYIMGCWGSPMTQANKDYYCRNHAYNQQTLRSTKIKSATSETYGFDCSGLIKGLLWSWRGNASHNRGGAVYASNRVPDVSANQMINLCKDVSTDFSRLQIGELLWMDGHVGLYIGSGQAVEATPAWKDGVQITTVRNIKAGTGHTWTKHGKLPWVTYTATSEDSAPAMPSQPTTSEKEEEVEVKIPTLKRGSTGSQVKALQAILVGYGGTPARLVLNAGGVDGDFGPGTEKAVLVYKQARGLTGGSDVGPTTWAHLLGTV